MQCIYALALSKSGSLEDQQKFLNQSIGQTYTLYLLILALLRELQQLAEERVEKASRKYLKGKTEDQDSPRRLSENQVLLQISRNAELGKALEKRKHRQ